MTMIILWVSVLFIPTICSLDDTCERCCMKNVVKPAAPTAGGGDNGYYKCFVIPSTTIHIDVIFANLSLGDDITDPNICSNNREDKSKNHFEIMNGRVEVFHCSGINLNQHYSLDQDISSPENTLTFNLTVGRSSTSEIVPWFEVYFNLTACPDEVGGIITRVKGPAFKINCTEGREGVDGEYIYNCVDGVWELYGKVVTPNCTEPGTDVSTSTTQKYSAITKIPDETCEYQCEEKWEKRMKRLEIGFGVFGAVVALGVAVTVIVLCVCHRRGKLQCILGEPTNSNTRQKVTDADRRDRSEQETLPQSNLDDAEINAAPQQSTEPTETPPNTLTPKSRSPLQIVESSQKAKKRCIIL